MTTQKLFKRRVRARMAKTGESYTTARQQLAARRDRSAPVPTDLGPALELASDEKMIAATGQGWEHWLTTLDEWGARDRKHGEIATYLHAELGVPGWWTQAITSGYERTRGMRRKHQHSDGYTVYASKTVNVPVAALFDAFVDESVRRQWLTDDAMSLRTSVANKTARFDWDGGPTRILVTFDAKEPMKSSAHVSHERLPDETVAEVAKSQWRKRVAALKAFLEQHR